MTDICEKTGLSRGGLYRHYSGTGEIFAEILSEEYTIADRIGRGESARAILEDMLEAIQSEIRNKELSLSLAIYEYANLGKEELFIRIHEKAVKRWISLIRYGMETGEFRDVNPQQGLRMWSRVIPFDSRQAGHYADTVRQMLLDTDGHKAGMHGK